MTQQTTTKPSRRTLVLCIGALLAPLPLIVQAEAPEFVEHVISTNADGAEAVGSADFNGDGIIDVFSASSRDDKIAW